MIRIFGLIFLVIMIIYILLKRRELIRLKFNLKKINMSKAIIFTIVIVGLIFLLDKGTAYLLSNKFPKGILTFFPDFKDRWNPIFKNITHMGEPDYVSFYLFPFFMYSKFRKNKRLEDLSLGALATMLIGGIIANILKIIFMRSRPYTEWNNVGFYFIEDVFEKEIPFNNNYMSFPSGHTLAAFSGYIYLYLSCKTALMKIIWLIFPMLVAFSRIYLSQHWLSDVFASAVIGSLIARQMVKNHEFLDNNDKK